MVALKEKREIMDFINGNECEIELSWINKNTYGAVNDDRDKILLNLYLIIAEVIIHEFMHCKYPSASEERIERKTNRKIKRLTVMEITEIARTTMIMSD